MTASARWAMKFATCRGLHNYYLQYRFTMDESMMRDRMFPLLKGSINYYLHLLKMGPDGYLHITDGYSPEYPGQPTPNPDCNIDLALLRWGCETLVATCDRFKIDDPLIPKWKETLAKLVPYPTDENGLMVSASVPFAVSHRHYSHLLMVYPLHIITWISRKTVIWSLNRSTTGWACPRRGADIHTLARRPFPRFGAR